MKQLNGWDEDERWYRVDYNESGDAPTYAPAPHVSSDAIGMIGGHRRCWPGGEYLQGECKAIIRCREITREKIYCAKIILFQLESAQKEMSKWIATAAQTAAEWAEASSRGEL